MAKATEKNGDTTTLRLKDIEKNVSIGVDDFKIGYHRSIKPMSAVAAEKSLQRSLNSALSRMDRHYRSMVSLAADIKMDRFNSQLSESDMSQGTLVFLPKARTRKMYARVDWIKPRVENLAVIGDEYMLYTRNLNTVYRGNISSTATSGASGSPLAFMSMSGAEVKKNYRAELIDREKLPGGVRTIRLRIIPLSGKPIRFADIWVDSSGMGRQVKVTEMNQNTTSVLLYNIRKNIKVDPNNFSIKVPKGTKVIKG